jgi:hypothetical protein
MLINLSRSLLPPSNVKEETVEVSWFGGSGLWVLSPDCQQIHARMHSFRGGSQCFQALPYNSSPCGWKEAMGIMWFGWYRQKKLTQSAQTARRQVLEVWILSLVLYFCLRLRQCNSFLTKKDGSRMRPHTTMTCCQKSSLWLEVLWRSTSNLLSLLNYFSWTSPS